ncbi:MAG: CHAT domain-containing protein [Clostridia bacterium]|nr:CHAT domain-containing protein [Clostridia bacterium]
MQRHHTRPIRRFLTVLFLLACLLIPSGACAAARALLVACSDFSTEPDLGAAISGNLHMIGSALISADIHAGGLSIEDGTIGTQEALKAAIDDAFSDSAEDDLSILYLCTHGVLSSSDDEAIYLLLGDGQNESPLSADTLYSFIKDIQGEKLLILDACFSGALIGRGQPDIGRLPGSHIQRESYISPFIADPSIHVLTSASGHESSWYYDSRHLSSGAVSYFASALSCGLGLYGTPEADLSGDGQVSLDELHRYLSAAVPSSTSQLLSAHADTLLLPVSANAALSRPLTGFSYGASLLPANDPTLEFSFTVGRDDTRVQYRLIDFDAGSWNWQEAKTFLDEGDDGSTLLSAGRKTRSLVLSDVAPTDSGYLMLQVFSVSGSELLLCSERLIAVQPETGNHPLRLSLPAALSVPGMQEIPIEIHAGVPAELTVSVFDSDGRLVRRLAAGQMTRPAPDGMTLCYWDGRDAEGNAVPSGSYTVTAEARICGVRQKASAGIRVGA